MKNNIVNNRDFVIEFTTEKPLDNVSAMNLFIEQYNLEDFVAEASGTMASFDFDGDIVHLSSYGGGDFFSHIIERLND